MSGLRVGSGLIGRVGKKIVFQSKTTSTTVAFEAVPFNKGNDPNNHGTSLQYKNGNLARRHASHFRTQLGMKKNLLTDNPLIRGTDRFS